MGKSPPRCPKPGKNRGSPVDRMLKFFAYDHLREDLQAVSRLLAAMKQPILPAIG